MLKSGTIGVLQGGTKDGAPLLVIGKVNGAIAEKYKKILVNYLNIYNNINDI